MLLQGFLAQPQGLVFFKAAHVDVGSNLKDLVDAANREFGRRGLEAGQKKRLELQAMFQSAPMMTSLGRMAAFELMGNNYDRFRPDGTASTTNLDFGNAQPLGIDNLDPFNRMESKALRLQRRFPRRPGTNPATPSPVFGGTSWPVAWGRFTSDGLAARSRGVPARPFWTATCRPGTADPGTKREIQTRVPKLVAVTVGLLPVGLLGQFQVPENAPSPDPSTAASLGDVDTFMVIYDRRKARATRNGADQQVTLSLKYTPGLSTVLSLAGGTLTLDLLSGAVDVRVAGLPDADTFDVWLIDNRPGPDRSVKPEWGDVMVRLGACNPTPAPPRFTRHQACSPYSGQKSSSKTWATLQGHS